eukprot:gene1627-1806_t
MLCGSCQIAVQEPTDCYCRYCGHKLGADLAVENDEEQSSQEETEDDFDEEDAIKYYFNCGYEYDEILLFLEKYHKWKLSYRTLLRRLNQYGLKRKADHDTEQYATNLGEARRRITELINGPMSFSGWRLVTDLGTENGIAAAIQAFVLDDSKAHRYVPSPRNQRIEGWWSHCSKYYTSWWRNFLSDLEFRNVIDMSLELSKECLWFCFSPLLQTQLDSFKKEWNTHRIRRSRHNAVAGRPDVLFFIPERHGGESNLLISITQAQVDYINEHIVINEEENDYTEYFEMIMNTYDLAKPNIWQEALSLYENLMDVAVNGNQL